MNRDQMMQLAQLALVTRDPDLMAKAVQELMAARQPEPLPLFDAPQPAVSDAGVSAASLAAALDNLPPLVAKQAPVQRVELEAIVPKASKVLPDLTPESIAGQACKLWHKLYGARWMSNTAAFGANAPWVAMNLRDIIDCLTAATPDMSQRAIGKVFWERIEQIKPKGWLVQERIRQCDGYSVTEHSIVPNGDRA
ncbi:MAG: hypothetical protein EBX40_00050 [Gammaproteobacteria bacterium]|nr:hypothetical protein [Gammaproteobacteria bacterium]